MGRATAKKLPWSLGPGEGLKSLNFNNKDNAKNCYTQLCVCSYKKNIKNISKGIFVKMPGSCCRGGTCVRRGSFF